jgi:hypothetical protein
MAALGVAVTQRRAAQRARPRSGSTGSSKGSPARSCSSTAGRPWWSSIRTAASCTATTPPRRCWGRSAERRPAAPAHAFPGAGRRRASAEVDARHPLWVEGRHLDARLTALRDANGAAVGSVLWVREGPRDARRRAHPRVVVQRRGHGDPQPAPLPRAPAPRTAARAALRPAARAGRDPSGGLHRHRARVHGAETADALLRAVAATVMADLRATDTLGRLCDDAVAVCLPDVDAARAEAEAARLLEEIGQVEVRATGAAVRAVASVAVVHAAREGADALVAKVEATLARARRFAGLGNGRRGRGPRAHAHLRRCHGGGSFARFVAQSVSWAAMNLQLGLVTLLLAVGMGAVLVLAQIGRRGSLRRRPALTLLVVAAALYACGYAIELTGDSVAWVLATFRVQHLAIAFAPTLVLWLAADYAPRSRLVGRWVRWSWPSSCRRHPGRRAHEPLARPLPREPADGRLGALPGLRLRPRTVVLGVPGLLGRRRPRRQPAPSCGPGAAPPARAAPRRGRCSSPRSSPGWAASST